MWEIKKANVDRNRKELASKYNYEYKKLISMNQTHGNNVQIVDLKSDKIIDDCDGFNHKCKRFTS